MDSIRRLDISYWVNDFYDRLFNAHQSKSKHIVYNDLNFFSEFAHKINILNVCGSALTNSTQMIQMDSNWDPTYYQSNKSYQTNGIINWFSLSESTYDVFTIVKTLLNPKKLDFISKDEYELLTKLLGTTQFSYCVFAFLINKVLLEIYKIWIVPNTKMDHDTISNKYDEILSKYSVQSNLCNKPNINGIYDKSIFEPTNLYKVLLYSQVGSDNYDCFLEIFNYLKSYYQIISDYQVDLGSISINQSVVKESKTFKTIKNNFNESDEVESEPKSSKSSKLIKSKSKKTNYDFTESNKSTEKSTKIKKKPIPPILKRNVWNKYIGEDIGKAKCTCCKLVDITQLSFHCGHIIAEAKGGELKMDNLKPICLSCNSSMGTMNMNEYIEKYGF